MSETGLAAQQILGAHQYAHLIRPTLCILFWDDGMITRLPSWSLLTFSPTGWPIGGTHLEFSMPSGNRFLI